MGASHLWIIIHQPAYSSVAEEALIVGEQHYDALLGISLCHIDAARERETIACTFDKDKLSFLISRSFQAKFAELHLSRWRP
jgi:hypothetical protein